MELYHASVVVLAAALCRFQRHRPWLCRGGMNLSRGKGLRQHYLSPDLGAAVAAVALFCRCPLRAAHERAHSMAWRPLGPAELALASKHHEMRTKLASAVREAEGAVDCFSRPWVQGVQSAAVY